MSEVMLMMLVEGGRMWQQVAEGDGDDVDNDRDVSPGRSN